MELTAASITGSQLALLLLLLNVSPLRSKKKSKWEPNEEEDFEAFFKASKKERSKTRPQPEGSSFLVEFLTI
jgi:hypothetical protein